MIIRKLFKAEMAHAVPGAYTERCHFLHGHSYKYEVFVRSDGSNSAHMVIDFKALKETGLGDFFDSFDHAVMVWEKDPVAKFVKKINPERHIIVPFVPTAEMMAKAFFMVAHAIIETASPKLRGANVEVESVKVHETDTGYAIFGLEDLPKDGFPSIHLERWVISKGIRNAWKNRVWFNRVRRALALIS